MIDKPVLLMILDGWGIGDHSAGDAIWNANPDYLNSLQNRFPHAQLRTDGSNVGLPDGQMGNSEVGHLNIGAGRVVFQDLVKINNAVSDGSIAHNPQIVDAFRFALEHDSNVHLMGLVSDGGVHSSLGHLYALCDLCGSFGIRNAFVHCFMDGRDTDPHSGVEYLKSLGQHISGSNVRIASAIGRYYAMDRDKRWERIKIAYDMLVNGIGEHSSDIAQSIRNAYDSGTSDEFLLPIVRVDEQDNPIGCLNANDVVIFFNFRNDRAKELSIVLTQQDMPEFNMYTLPLYYCTMTPYDDKFNGVHVLFDKQNVTNTIGEYIASLGLTQLRIAETEKYAHVTFFLNGGREDKFQNEERILIPSPKVATYDLKPEMSAPEITEALVAAIETHKFDFIVLNFANGDMVGHTGVYEAISQAVKTVDSCAGKVIDAASKNGYETIVIADHGNADNAVNADGSPNTAHSLNPVPIIVVSDRVKAVRNGVLADVAPTVLALMGLPQPPEMTGTSLVQF